MSSDPNLAEFYLRVARIQQDHARGLGFEAEGTLGRSHSRPPVRRRTSLIKPLLIVLTCGIGLKAAIHSRVGAMDYDKRVALLMQGEGVERLGGHLMQADPVTRLLSEQLRVLIPVDI